MNIIDMDHDCYKRYFYNQGYAETQFKRYFDWLLGYHKNGEVAFNNYIVISEHNKKMIVQTTFDKGDNAYGIVVSMPLVGNDCGGRAAPIFFSCSLKDQRYADICIDIVPDKVWEERGIETVLDLPKELRQQMVFMAKPILAMFAKIQTEAMKNKRKLVCLGKYGKMSQNKSIKQRSIQPTYKPIHLCSGVTYYYRQDNQEPRSFTRHCESWSVRGHYRHYKNGKTVYIKPHKKGKGRLKDTTYRIEQ